MNQVTRFIFITGGVVSSLGKGITAAVLGNLLKAQGFSIRLRKLDPYLNIDPGTMSPFQHGEVYVTDDGIETDLDLGHYERFTGIPTKSTDYITTGKIYESVLKKERKGEYIGATVQVIPHITNQIKEFIINHTQNLDFVICEIGGTVGDIEVLPFLEAIRQMRYDLGPSQTMFIHLTLLPYIKAAKELKTKPCQHSVKTLQSAGIQPDLLVCRAEEDFLENTIQKLSLFCNLPENRVIKALDVSNIYEIPLTYHESQLDTEVLNYFNLSPSIEPLEKELSFWKGITRDFKPQKKVKVGIIGKYLQVMDSYKSLIEAIKHASYSLKLDVDIIYFDAEQDKLDFSNMQAILVPGGFGQRGFEGKLKAIQYARENKIPYLGICLGAQLMCVEFARNILHISDANTTEFDPKTLNPVVILMEEWVAQHGIEKRSHDANIGGTMRLGSYPCAIRTDTLAYEIYQMPIIEERHRHRYEINAFKYKEQFEQNGLLFSGTSPNGLLPEIVELKDHPFFIGVQFHPELKSYPFKPNPLFVKWLDAI